MGVPITFLDKYNPEQFEILGIDRPLIEAITGKVSRFRINENEIYARIVIKNKNPADSSIADFCQFCLSHAPHH